MTSNILLKLVDQAVHELGPEIILYGSCADETLEVAKELA